MTIDKDALAVLGAETKLDKLKQEIAELLGFVGRKSTAAISGKKATVRKKPHWTKDKAKLAAAQRKGQRTRRRAKEATDE